MIESYNSKEIFMNSEAKWDPSEYLKFKDERTRPSIDLVSRINIFSPETVIDIGCGPGNSTEVLKKRWPGCTITGIDNSPEMIEKAKQDFPDQKWHIQDASCIDSNTKYDVVFSNAAIQWIPDHEKLVPDFLQLVRANGALAIQTPLFNGMPVRNIIDDTFKDVTGKDDFNINNIFTFHDAQFYYDLLANIVERLEMWETSYIHIMDSHKKIIEMIRSTGMKPYLESIDDIDTKLEFEKNILNRTEAVYKTEKNGKVLFPFRRLFFIAYK